MFEREIKFIYDFNLNKVNKLGPYFTFEQLQSTDIHPAILQYISAEIDYLVFEDRQKLLKNSVFDYSGEKISYHFNEITEELKKIKRFSLEYIAKLILHSTSFTVNFLVRPKWTLTRFIFDEAQHKTSNEIKQILNYIYYYKFLKKIITSYINSKKILSMNTEEFDELLNRADKLGVETNLKGILSHSFISMAEFFNIGQLQKTRIPLTAVELFLEEKDLPQHLRQLTNTFGNDENARFNIGDYIKILTTVMVTTKEEEPEQDQLILFDEHTGDFSAVKQEEVDIQTEPDQEIAGSHEETLESVSTVDTLENIETPVPDDNFVSADQSDFETEEHESDKLETEYSGEENFESEIDISRQKPAGEESTEIISSPEEEITIKPHTKIRIKVKEDNKLETIPEEEIKNENEIPVEESESETDEFDSYSTIIRDEADSEDQLIEETEQEYENQNESYKADEEETIDLIVTKDIVHLIESEENEQEDFSYDEDEISEEQKENSIVDEEKPVTFQNIFEESMDEQESKETENYENGKLDLAEILEHKNMTKIIEVIFDYDIEDFANMLDEISNSRNIEDAHFVVNETLGNRRINLNSKEVETLRNIVTEYFDRK